MGGPQFLPSVYLRMARDGDGDGRADIWNSDADTLASIGNYFYNAGWRRGQPWGLAVSVPATFDRSGVTNKLISPRCPKVFARQSGWRTIAEWRALGIVPQSKPWPAANVQATLIEPDGPGKTAYLLTGNYRVILDYYFYNAGWRRGQPWGLAVSMPATFDRSGVTNKLISPRCPKVFARQSGWRSIAEWRALGIVPQSKAWPASNVQATLIEPDGPGKTAYLLTGNYRVILDYNCSNFYALSVGLLADAVE